jgi:excisionase family DNA binding protein
MTAPALLTEAEAAEALKVCSRTLRKARAEGRLQFVQIGRAVRYRPDQLDAFINDNSRIETPCPDPSQTAARRISNTISSGGNSGFMALRNKRLAARRKNTSTA